MLRTVYDCISDLQKQSSLADDINFPKLPSTLTESLVVHLVRLGVILPEFKGAKIDLGGGRADILVDGGRAQIEVKGTTENKWVTLGKKDVTADFLVWIYFPDYFTSIVPHSVEVYVFKNPGEYLNMGKPVLKTLLRLAGPNVTKASLDIDQFLRRA